MHCAATSLAVAAPAAPAASAAMNDRYVYTLSGGT